MRKSKGRIFRRGDTLWVAFYRDGKEHRESSHSSDEPVAQDLLDKRLREVANDADGIATFTEPQSRRLKISDLVASLREHYKLEGRLTGSTESELKRVEGVKDEDDVIRFGDIRALALTAKHVADYKRDRLAKGHAQASINRTLTFLARCYALAIENEVLNAADKPPIKLFPVGTRNARKGFFSRADFDKVLAHLPEDLRDFASFGFNCGWRKGEISGLTWNAIHDGRITLAAADSKNGETRTLVISGELTQIIERRKSARMTSDGMLSNLVFHREGRAIYEFRKAWRTACKKAGFAGRLFHDLRRSAVRNLIRSGVPQNVAMRVSGHKSISMFRRYDVCSEDDLAAAMVSVEKYNKDAAASQSNVVSIAK
jgi:integrase